MQNCKTSAASLEMNCRRTRAWKLESMIDNMMANEIDAYLIQKNLANWRLGEGDKRILGNPPQSREKEREKGG